jgi:hypothetical protein
MIGIYIKGQLKIVSTVRAAGLANLIITSPPFL